jgi:ubiquinone/menaquinone biosynthesis C-methylase UbiE
MTTNYDLIAEQYQHAKQQPWRGFIEAYTLLKLIGDLTGQSVVDLACGEGFYSRLLRQKGAGRVVGVDLSQRMIELARTQEARHSQGIEYRIGDAKCPGLAPEYDLVVAAYLLNYSRDRDELAAMCRGVAGCLRPGGRFVTVNCNPAQDFRTAPSYRKYGFETRVDGEFREGSPIIWTLFLEDRAFEIENYYLDVALHEQALQAAGFKKIHWHPPKLSPQGTAACASEYWSAFLDNSPVTFLECVK